MCFAQKHQDRSPTHTYSNNLCTMPGRGSAKSLRGLKVKELILNPSLATQHIAAWHPEALSHNLMMTYDILRQGYKSAACLVGVGIELMLIPIIEHMTLADAMQAGCQRLDTDFVSHCLLPTITETSAT